jgi:hypothetical protein
VNFVPLRSMSEVAELGETLTEIAALAYRYAPDSAAAPAAKERGNRKRSNRR